MRQILFLILTFFLLQPMAMADKFDVEEQNKVLRKKLEEADLDEEEIKEALAELEKERSSLLGKRGEEKINFGKLNEAAQKSILKTPQKIIDKYLGERGRDGLDSELQKVATVGIRHFQAMSHEDVMKHIRARIKGSRGEYLMMIIPRSYELLVEFLRHDTAPILFFNILENRLRLWISAIVTLSLIAFGWYAKRKMDKKFEENDIPEAERKIQTWGRSILFWSIKMTFLFAMFREEFSPMLDILKAVYL